MTYLVLQQCNQLNQTFIPTSFRRIQDSRLAFRTTTACYCTSRNKVTKIIPDVNDESDGRKQTESVKNIPQSVAEKYIEFQDRTRVIQDVIEEAWDPSIVEEEPRQRILYESKLLVLIHS